MVSKRAAVIDLTMKQHLLLLTIRDAPTSFADIRRQATMPSTIYRLVDLGYAYWSKTRRRKRVKTKPTLLTITPRGIAYINGN